MNAVAPAEPDLDRLLVLALAAVEARRLPQFERRRGERRTGVDRRTGVASDVVDERRIGRGRRQGVERRVTLTALPFD
jgi:hypothetical protein